MNKKILFIGLVLFLTMLSSAFAVGTAPDSADALVYWTYDDDNLTGSENDDVTGNGYNSVSGGTAKTTGVTGIVDEAFTYPNTLGYSRVGSSTSLLNGESTVSFSIWTKLTSSTTDFATIVLSRGSELNGLTLATGNDVRFYAKGSVAYSQSVNLRDSNWHHLVGTYDGTTAKIYIDGVLINSSAVSGSLSVNDYYYVARDDYSSAWILKGEVDEFAMFTTALTSDEVDFLYNAGAPTTNQQYPFISEVISQDEVFPQIIDATYDLNVTINSNSYQEIFTETFIPLNNTLSYNTWVIQLEAVNKDTVATCKAEVNGTAYNTETNVSLLAGEYGIMYLYSDDYNLTANTTYEAKVSCKRDLTSGAKLTISDVEGQITLFTDLDGTVIQDLFGDVTANLTSSSFVEIYSENFTTSNYTGDNLQISLIADGEATYTHDSTGFIELYLEVDGVAGAIAEKYGVAGSVNNGAELDMIKNVTANTNVTVKVFARSTTSDGAVHTRFNLMELFTHPYETAFNNLSNTAITTGTWATIDTLYINNSGHSTHDIAIKTEFNVESLSGAQQAYYRIKIGTEYSQERVIEINTVDHAMALEHHLVSNPGNVNTSIELQAYTTSANANITHGEIMAYLVNQVNAIPQFYEVTARNVYDNATILTFNVTDDSGSTYNSNATGGVSIFNVNGLANFTTSATGYFNTTTLNHDTTTNITVDMIQSIITFNATELITNNTAVGNITIGAETKTSNETWNLASGTYNATFSGATYFNQTVEFNVTALDIETIDIANIYGSILNVSFVEIFTNVSKTNVSGYYTNEQYGLNISFDSGANSYVQLGIVQGLYYNVTVDEEEYALITNEYLVNQSVQNETFYLYIINSVNIVIQDEITREIINDTTFQLEFIGETQAFNASTSNGTYYVDLVTPDAYQIRYFSTSSTEYSLRSYTFDLINQSFNEIVLYAISTNETLVQTTFNVFSTALDPVEGVTVIIERYYVGDNGYSQVSSGTTNVDGVYVDFVEATDAFYRYKLIYEDEIKYQSPSTGTQFSVDTSLTNYIELFADNYEQYDEIFNIPTTITYTNLTNYTGYFDFSYSNPNLYQLCFEVYINNSVTTETCPTVSASGSVQIAVNVSEDTRTVAIATAKAYSTNVQSYVVYATETKTFYLSGAFTQVYNDLFNFGLSIILTIVALVFIRFPVVNVFIQTFVLVLFAVLPLPFYTISIITIGWIVSFNLIILWIIKKDGVPQ